ncbi:MAG: DegV family protein [Thermaerobacter sp.]|nr:DegV family protein [Thermaerobacter sp.]
MSIAVVTDSAADLNPAFCEQHRVSVVPLTIEYGGQSYQDRVDLEPEDFLSDLPHLRDVPKTAAPSPGAFLDVYQRRLEAGLQGILSVHLAGGLSATVRAAEAASRMVDGPVQVVDGESASLGTGLLVWWAARRAANGVSLDGLAAEVTRLKSQLFALAAPVTLEYLARGGRIGQAARLVGTLLDMKPILILEQGIFRPERKVRGEQQIVPAMLASAAQRVPAGSPVLAALGHCGMTDAHQKLMDAVNDRYQVLGWLEGVIGPVISTHVGPGAYGLIMLPLTHDQKEQFQEVGS